MKYKNQFGQAFKRVRRACGLTQEDFAQESGRTYVSELERGLKHPTLQKIDELSVPMGVHPLTTIVLSYLSKGGVAALDRLLAQVRNETNEIFVSESKKKND